MMVVSPELLGGNKTDFRVASRISSFHSSILVSVMVRASVLPALFLLLLLATPARSDPVRPELQNCSAGARSDQRQRCDDEAFKQVETRSQTTQLDHGWRLVRTRDPRGGADAVSVMHVVDTGKSDASLAGLSLQCGQDGIEVVLIVLEPLSRTTRPAAVLTAGNKRARFEASVVQTGEALLLPRAASVLAAGEWQSATELSVEIETKPTPIRGTVPISGLSTAIQQLSQNCVSR
jgi:hypothetical protein